ncbi:NUDIX hydrolase [Alteromonas lipolytica]|nr:NUDIX domain-containing protein [Alteromonas lipolytica]
MSQHYCPRCGQSALTSKDNNCYQCSKCDFEVFRNVAAAVGAVLVYNQSVLLLKRGKAPSAGEWDLPGGFVNPNESAEQALRREMLEETGITLTTPLRYLGAWPNQYPYKSLVYPTMDIFFVTELSELPDFTLDKDEVSAYQWFNKDACQGLALAFPSAQHALNTWLNSGE